MAEPVYIIAEAGVNHNGSLEMAKKLIDVAAAAGADVVKFQSFRAQTLLTQTARKADYQLQTTGDDESQFEMLKKLELTEPMHRELLAHCRASGIEFLSSAFDLDTIDLLRELGLKVWKIPSGEITNLPYLRKIGSLGQEVILSTGMADLEEIGDALDILEAAGTDRRKIIVLHCNTEYPTPMSSVNLRAMQTIAATFPGIRVGYSDHTQGIEVPIAAVAMGAVVVEKHFTLDKTLPGPDHKASLEPDELADIVRAIRNIEQALGDGVKRPSVSELKNKPIARRSIIAARDIVAGEQFTEENLTVKRPGTGISPMRWYETLDRSADRDYRKDELIDA
ncbi:MAG: N-acetylneuraminate synthase [Phycisphaerae bacterium]|nr:N-acetylneuraminate synthase [Phycisphaerae bacterium]